MRRTDFEQTIYCEELKDNIKGFIDPKIKKILKDNSSSRDENNNPYTILSGMEFRPDKVAAYYLGDPNLSWMIDFANNFVNGIRDYRLGRTIRIPNLEIANTILKDYIER